MSDTSPARRRCSWESWPDLADRIACSLAQHTWDVREAIHFGRLCQPEEDLHGLLRLKWPGATLF